jgi:hypothetical protein
LGSGAYGIVIGLVAASHWLLDLIVHRADLPILPGNIGNLPRLGFGLWRYPLVSQHRTCVGPREQRQQTGAAPPRSCIDGTADRIARRVEYSVPCAWKHHTEPTSIEKPDSVDKLIEEKLNENCYIF